MNYREFIAELIRRKVMRTGGAYLVGALAVWGGVEVASDAFHWSDEVLRITILASLVGLPLSLIASWLFEVRPEMGVGGYAWPRALNASGALGVGIAGGTLTFILLNVLVASHVQPEAPDADPASSYASGPEQWHVANKAWDEGRTEASAAVACDLARRVLLYDRDAGTAVRAWSPTDSVRGVYAFEVRYHPPSDQPMAYARDSLLPFDGRQPPPWFVAEDFTQAIESVAPRDNPTFEHRITSEGADHKSLLVSIRVRPLTGVFEVPVFMSRIEDSPAFSDVVLVGMPDDYLDRASGRVLTDSLDIQAAPCAAARTTTFLVDDSVRAPDVPAIMDATVQALMRVGFEIRRAYPRELAGYPQTFYVVDAWTSDARIALWLSPAPPDEFWVAGIGNEETLARGAVGLVQRGIAIGRAEEDTVLELGPRGGYLDLDPTPARVSTLYDDERLGDILSRIEALSGRVTIDVDAAIGDVHVNGLGPDRPWPKALRNVLRDQGLRGRLVSYGDSSARIRLERVH